MTEPDSVWTTGKMTLSSNACQDTTLMSRLLTSLFYEISGTDPMAYALAVVVLLGMGLLASIGPAWRAAARDPLPALRMD
jgi:ABC-type lipoprotein release transport system permease subunit